MSEFDFGTRVDPFISLDRFGTIGKSKKNQSLEKTAQDFESFLIYSVLKEFEKAMHLTKKSYAEETQMALFHEKIADQLAKKGTGIREMLTKYAERAAKVPGKIGEKR